ncbi:MAG: NHL repeat-containing protein [Pseudobdellovibrionaceae bacterium]
MESWRKFFFIISCLLALGCGSVANSKGKGSDFSVSQSADLTFINNIPTPFGVSVFDDQIFVSDLDSARVLLFKLDGRYLKSFSGNLKRPHSVLKLDSQHVVISDYGGQVLKINRETDAQEPFFPGFSGFKGPVHTLPLKDGGFLVTDFDRSELFFFDSKKQYRQSFSESVNQAVGFSKPHMAAQDKDGNLYVVDSQNHRIVKISASGKYLGWLNYRKGENLKSYWSLEGSAKASSEPGKFDVPVSIFLLKDQFYVADVKNGRIQKFDLSGQWLSSLGRSEKLQLNWPYEGVPYQDKIYVADSKNKRIVIAPLDFFTQK